MDRERVLGVGVDMINREDTLRLLAKWVETGDSCKQVVTAYSEFFVTAQNDSEFRQILNEADLVVPDGGSVLAAMRYRQLNYKLQMSNYKFRGFRRVLIGVGVGLDLFRGRLGETVTGVWLFERLIELAAKKGLRVFLLGGFGDTGERLVKRLQFSNSNLRIQGEAGEPYISNDEVVREINRFEPDLLFVAYGPVRQEKWIARHRNKLKVKVAIGVGGTFDEVLGRFPRAPKWFEAHGVKWLWRLVVQPRRIGRIWRAVVVFPWLVFRNSCSRSD